MTTLQDMLARRRRKGSAPVGKPSPSATPHFGTAPISEDPASSRSVHVLVTTYNRPVALQRLIEDVRRSKGSHDVSMAVYDDASVADYGGARELVEAEAGWTWVRAAQNHGKRRFWAWINHLLADARQRPEDVFVMLQDDVRLCDRFFDRALNVWDRVEDRKRATLTLMRDARTSRGSWSGHPAVDCGPVFLTGWVDGIYLAHRRSFDALGWRLRKIQPSRWQNDPRRSSGVGEQASARLSAAGLRMYGVKHSLLVHAVGESKLNAVERRHNPLISTHFVDGPTVGQDLAMGRSK